MSSRLVRASAVIIECVIMLLFFVTVTFVLYEIYFQSTYYHEHILSRYFSYIGSLVRFDLGTRADGVQVSFFIRPALTHSLLLFLPPLLAAAATAYGAARLYFIRSNPWFFRSIHGASRVLASIPGYWIAFVLLGISMTTRWFPISGVSSPGHADLAFLFQIADRLYHLVLPYICLYLFPTVVLSSMLQDRVQALSREPYIITALSQGLTKKTIFSRQLSRPVWAEALLQTGVYMPVFITMMVIIERVFVYPGLGTIAIEPYSRTTYISVVDSKTAQAAVTYLGIISIIIQYGFRTVVKLLLPEPPGASATKAPRFTAKLQGLLILLLLPVLGQLSHMIGGFSGGAIAPVIGLIVFAMILLFGIAVLLKKREHGGFQHKAVDPLELSEAPSVLTPEGYAEDPKLSPRGSSYIRDVRFWIACAAVIAILGGSWFVPEQVAQSAMFRRSAVELSWWDALWAPGSIIGRSLLASRYALIPAAAACIGSLLGAVLGIFSGLSRGSALDHSVRSLEIFPSVIIYILVSSFFDGHPLSVLIPFGLIASIRMFRIIRFDVIRLLGSEYIEYAHLLGCGFWTILFRHILPNIKRRFSLTLTEIAIDMIILEVNLSFIGRLFRPEGRIGELMPVQGWGTLFRDARHHIIRSQWDQVFIPAVVFILCIFALRVLSDRLRHHFREASL